MVIDRNETGIINRFLKYNMLYNLFHRGHNQGSCWACNKKSFTIKNVALKSDCLIYTANELFIENVVSMGG